MRNGPKSMSALGQEFIGILDEQNLKNWKDNQVQLARKTNDRQKIGKERKDGEMREEGEIWNSLRDLPQVRGREFDGEYLGLEDNEFIIN